MSAMFGLASGRLSISPSSSWSYAKSVQHDVHAGQVDHPKLALNPTSRSTGQILRSLEPITVCRRIYGDAIGRAEPDLVSIAVCSPREQNGISRRRRKHARRPTNRLVSWKQGATPAAAFLARWSQSRCFSAPCDQKRTTWSADEQTPWL